MNYSSGRHNFLMAAVFVLLASCSGGGGGGSDDGGSSSQTLTKLATVMLGLNETSTHTVNVPDGSSSLTIIADGGTAMDIDISNITDPTGFVMVSENFATDPIGNNFTQRFGGSVASFTVPHSDSYGFTPGEWSFTIKSYPIFGRGWSSDVSIYTVVKTGLGSTLDINVWLVAINDYQGDGDPNLATMLDEFKRLLGKAGITVGNVNIRELGGEQAESLTFPDMGTDSNFDGQADDLDELFRLSSQAGNDYLNIFLVRSLGAGILGISGGIPGPHLIQGTAHSGVVFSTFGGLTQMSHNALITQGETMAHEVGHFMGLFHTTESSGKRFDPIADTQECTRAEYDTNGDGKVTSKECADVDGENLMFWQAASFAQETFSSTQSRVMRLTPAVK